LPSQQASLDIDGIFGPLTKGKVIEFQTTFRLLVDGVVGSETWNALLSAVSGVGTDTGGYKPPTPPTLSGSTFWGVDCIGQADKPLGNTPTAYDYVLSKSDGRPPAFFGRYLTPNQYQYISESEKAYLRDRNCRILLCFNDFYGSEVQKGRDSGLLYASRAADMARRLQVPASPGAPLVHIYANIDSGFIPTVEWLAGWLDGVWSAGYGPGLYYSAAGSTRLGKAFERCSVPNPDQTIAIWTWSEKKSYVHHEGNKATVVVPPFSPTPPKGHPNVVRVWQYAGPCFPYKGDRKKSFDMNVANSAGYRTMWQC
jgi:hypothetical protein